MADPTDSSTGASGVSSRRMSMTVIQDSNLSVPKVSTQRRGSFDLGWLSKSVRGFTLDQAVDIPISPQPSDAKPAFPKNDDTKPSALLNVPASDENKGLGPRRKSESAIWKWFNTPMSGERDIKGTVISEKEEIDVTVPVAATPSGSTNLTQMAQQMSQMGERKPLVDTKKFTAMKDLNAISPSNW